MILLDMQNKNDTTASSLPMLVTPNEKDAVSFSQILKGMRTRESVELAQNGSFVLSLQDEKKSDSQMLASLLKPENDLNIDLRQDQEQAVIHPKLLAAFDQEEIKKLIYEAKNYLKEQIKQSEGYKKAEIKDLPKTLNGLVEVAKKFDIDISKISFEELKQGVKEGVALNEKTRSENSSQKNRAEESLHKQEFVGKENTTRQNSSQKEIRPEISLDKKIVSPEEKKVISTAVDKQRVQEENVVKEEYKNQRNNMQEKNKETPLFKAQTSYAPTTTEQLVQAKVSTHLKTDEKTPKVKADETLKLLLREESAMVKSPSLTSDFSVATAKVIAPIKEGDTTDAFKQLLRERGSDVSEENTALIKTDSAAAHKSDSFEIKLHEAKQMMKYLSNDIKGAIEEYKPPFTRIRVQLNPAHLGEMDLTVVQRGKNLHVNLSANSAALNTLVMHANELKVQLNNSGINNATLNFNDGSQGGDANGGAKQQQKHHDHDQRAHQEYRYFEDEETHEEVLSSLEILVPRYI